MISIKHLNKAKVLAALYNASKPQGLGFIHFIPKPMSTEEAENILRECGENFYFDYLKGRVLKVNLGKDDFDPRLYDRDNGDGAACRAIAELDAEEASADGK